MKKLLIGLLLVIVLLVAAVIVVPMVIPVETYKQAVVDQVKEKTGRDFRINGSAALSLFPRFALELNDVEMANIPGGTAENMAALKQLKIALDVWPAIQGDVRVDEFIMVAPVINLERLADGKANWEFEAMAGSDSTDTSTDSDSSEDGGGLPIDTLSLGTVTIQDGQFSFNDAASGQQLALSDLNVAVTMPDPQAPLGLEGKATFNGEVVDIKANVAKVAALLEGGASDVSFDVSAAPLKTNFAGSAGLQGPKVDGKLSAEIASIRALLKWLSIEAALPNDQVETLTLTSGVAMDGARYKLAGVDLKLDALTAKGDIEADLSGAVPSIKADLATGPLDLNPYLPPAGEGGGATDTANTSGPAGWSDEKVDLSGLQAANVDAKLTVPSLLIQAIKIGEAALHVTLQGGKLVADMPTLKLYDGNGVGKATVDSAASPAKLAAEFNLSGIQAEPLLTDATGFTQLSGTGNLNLNVTTAGESEKQWVGGLNGTSGILFNDGAIKGIDIVGMIRNVQSAFGGANASDARTEFAELSGTFKFTNGVADNQDLKLQNPLLRVTGAGTIDLPQRSMNYRVEPKAVASLEGQGGAQDAAGIAVPVVIVGPWENLSFKPDLEGLLKSNLKDPKAAIEGAKSVIEGVKEGGTGKLKDAISGGGVGGLLKSVTGGDSAAPADKAEKSEEAPAKPSLKDVGGALKGLLNN